VHLNRAKAEQCKNTRDFEGNKCVEMSAVILARMLRQLVVNYIKTLRNKIYDRCNKGKHIDVAALVAHDDTLTRDVAKAFSDGEVTVQKDASNAGLGVILMVQQGNKLAVETDIERVSTALPRDGKYVMGRALDCSSNASYGAAQTPEGAAVGLLQNPAVCARVRLSTAAPPVLSQLLALGAFAARVLTLEFAEAGAPGAEAVDPRDKDEAASLAKWCRSPAFIRPLDSLQDMCSRTAPPATAFVVSLNGEPVGVTDNEELFARVARAARRQGVLPRDASIVRDAAWRGIAIFVDAGVIVRATLHLPSIHLMPDAVAAAARNSTLLWHELERAGIVDWVDAWEGNEYRVADLVGEVSAYLARADPLERPFSHIIPHPQAFFSTGESTVPFPDHDQGPRVVYQSAMGCQTMCTPSENVWARLDFLSANVLWYPQKPLASTDLARAKGLDDFPMGQNLMIAIANSGGLDQEDALILNEDSQQRGLLRATVLKIERDVAKARGSVDVETFERPGACVQGLRAGVNYDTIGPDGMPCIGAPLRNGDAVVGKTMTSTTELDAAGRPKTVIRDRTRVLECDPSETYYVDKVAVMPKDGRRMVRVRLRTTRIMEEGDKACLTPDHDVLVLHKGWISIADVTTDDAIATLDRTTGSLTYACPSAVWAYEHAGELLAWESTTTSLCVTPDHRMWLAEGGAESHLDWKLVPAARVREDVASVFLHAAPRGVLHTAAAAATAAAATQIPFPGFPDLLAHETAALPLRCAFLQLFAAWIVRGSTTPRPTGHDVFISVYAWNADELVDAARCLGIDARLDAGKHHMHLVGWNMEAQDTFAGLTRLLPWMLELDASDAALLLSTASDASEYMRDQGSWLVRADSAALASDWLVVCAHAGVAVFLDDGYIYPIDERDVAPRRSVVGYHGPVHCVSVPGEVFLVRRHGKLCFTGNSARHGQKGTIGERRRQWDMPFVADGPNAGMTPDAIINVAAMNGRMTIGMLLEMLFSALGLVRGQLVDATPFRNVSARWAIAELCKSGYGVNVNMIDGRTGVMIEGSWFLGPCFYQRLKHMVLDKLAKRQRGLRAALTHQPMGGRSSGEAQRFGPMEALTLLAHGGAFTADDAMRVRSDAHSVPVCLRCGTIVDDHAESLAALIETSGTGAFCRLCRAYTPQVVLATTYCNNLWQREVAGLGVKVTHDMGTGAARCADRTCEEKDDDDDDENKDDKDDKDDDDHVWSETEGAESSAASPSQSPTFTLRSKRLRPQHTQNEPTHAGENAKRPRKSVHFAASLTTEDAEAEAETETECNEGNEGNEVNLDADALRRMWSSGTRAEDVHSNTTTTMCSDLSDILLGDTYAPGD
jgi:DNA-directed RNA polymerase beta subunit